MVAQIKILRNEARLTQAELAEMLGTTQQTIARWESGKSEPNITALKDLAMIFGCSVGDLLEMSEYQRPSSVRLHWMGNSFDGFWGHFGVRLDGGGHTRWFPISAGESQRIRRCLSSAEVGPWVSVWTLNNRVLYVNTNNVSRVLLVDDDCDPQEDWEHKDQALGFEQGIASEIFRALESLLETEDDLEAWETDASDNYKATVLDFVEKSELDRDNIETLLFHTHVYLSNGDRLSYWADDTDLYNLDFSVGLGDVEKLVEVSTAEGEEHYYPAQKTAMVDVPQVQLVDEFNRVLAELEEES